MKRIVLGSLGICLATGVWAQRPVTPASPARPVTSVSAVRPQTTVEVVRPQTNATVIHPTTEEVSFPKTTVQVITPQTTVSANYPQTNTSAVYPKTTVVVEHPQTTVEVLHPQTPGFTGGQDEKLAGTTSKSGKTSSGKTSSQATTSMSNFTPKQAKDFKKEESKIPQFGGGSLALGNDTTAEGAKDDIASSQVRRGQRESVENADLTKNSSAALAGLDKMLTDRAKVQQKK